MFRALLSATLVLAFGLAVGCGDSKSNGKAPPPSNGGGGGSQECPSGQVWSSTLNKCVGENDYADGFDLFSTLNITDNKTWAKFLDDYYFATYISVCRVEGNLYWPVGVNDCETYTRDRTITLNLNELVISESGNTKGSLILTAGSTWGTGYYNIFLPIGVQEVSVSRIAINDVPNSGFQMQMTIAGRNGPKIFRIRGNSVDLVATDGADVELFYGDPSNMRKIGSASLYLYE